ncbi:MAG: hypothetical protein KA712_17855 [Myxococcales bacterium]|nr:hypothetical protein [Myxococcales bacterium]
MKPQTASGLLTVSASLTGGAARRRRRRRSGLIAASLAGLLSMVSELARTFSASSGLGAAL